MLKKTITYTDWKGAQRTEDFYFNLTQTECVQMEMSKEGGLIENINRIVERQDGVEIMNIFKDLISTSYGEKSPDGRRFVKSAQLSEEFMQTPAYDILFMELVTKPEAAAAFVQGIVPQSAE